MQIMETSKADQGRAQIAKAIGGTDIGSLEEQITQDIVDYSKQTFRTSRFFRELGNGKISLPRLQYVFLQYRYWRDQFHTWFGLCILKSGSCEQKHVKDAVLELADHTLVEMKEDHAGLYVDFLKHLGVSDEDIKNAAEGDSTRRYEQSFLTAFGTETNNFVDSVIALSARELFAAIRNTYVTKALKDHYGIDQSPWWQLHERLEIDHFRNAIRPVLSELGSGRRATPEIAIMKSEIDRHADYWDGLLGEAKTVVSS